VNQQQENTCQLIKETLPGILADNFSKSVQEYSAQESRRLFHGRGGCYPGLDYLTIDWYAPVLLITLYKGFIIPEIFPHETEKSEQQLCLLFQEVLLTFFASYFPGSSVKAIVLQSRIHKVAETKVIFGFVPEACVAHESQLNFYLDLNEKQNVGFFLDMRKARQWLATQCEGKKVLNLFSFTCAFSVVALAARAKSVVNLDMGQGVLKRGEQNHQLNQLDLRSVQFIKSDIFKAWKKLHKYGRYDIVIIDPPSFQRGSFIVEKDYLSVVKNLHKLLAPNAQILACLNSPFLGEDFLDKLFLENALNQGEHRIQKVMRLKNPEVFCDLNSDSGLKVVVYQYQRSQPGLQATQAQS
jgi:23S rRNA (cytosine1962-C5)-methyltransferase